MSVGQIGSRPDARIQLIPNPVASPGCCIICGSHEHPVGFADARLDVEFYGTIIFCGNCSGSFAALFGWISPQDYEALQRSNAALQLENSGYEARLTALGAVENAITSYLTDYGDIDPSVAALRDVSQPEEFNGESQVNSTEPVEPIVVSPKLTVVKGPDDSADVASLIGEYLNT